MIADEAFLRQWLFEKKTAEVLFLRPDGREIGSDLYFHNFLSFWAVQGLVLGICTFFRNIVAALARLADGQNMESVTGRLMLQGQEIFFRRKTPVPQTNTGLGFF